MHVWEKTSVSHFQLIWEHDVIPQQVSCVLNPQQKKTSNSLLHQLMCPSNHLTSLKVYHQYVETEEMSLFCFHRAVKFWIRVESLDNQASVWRGYLNIMLFLWESVWLSFFFWREEGLRGQQNKESVAGHSLFQRKMIPVGKKERGIKTRPLFQCFYFVPVVFHIILTPIGMRA